MHADATERAADTPRAVRHLGGRLTPMAQTTGDTRALCRPASPWPRRGLDAGDFRLISENGFGDGHNSFAHAAAWFDGRLVVGTTRSNLQMLRFQAVFKDLPVHCWPVEGPENSPDLYKLDRRAQIWSYDPQTARWEQVFQAPMVDALDTGTAARETGYRAMTVFQGASDSRPTLYSATFCVSRSPGALLLRSPDGRTFEPASDYGIIPGTNITGTRLLLPFKGRLFTSPTSTRGHNVRFVANVAGLPIIYETRDAIGSEWMAVCEPAFGNTNNLGIFTMAVFNDQVYAATINNTGFELWRSECAGDPPYRWTRVIERGADRGPENQAVASMAVFRDTLYLGTGIQNGGYDRTNNIGPAGAELIRVNADDSWDLIVGKTRSTPVGYKEALSALPAGFGNLCNGYIWSMAVHDDWLYIGTMDSSIWVEWLDLQRYPKRTRKLLEGIGIENILANEAGCDLWRTADGENFLPVTRTGFGNRYNLGIRNMVSTPAGLFVGMANPFGPQVAVRGADGAFGYVDNPRGGLEVWLGQQGNL
jgi:hypothetical protein